MPLAQALLFIAMIASPPDTLGTLEGRVVDAAGHGVSFASVVVVGTRRGAQTTEDGRFTITLLPPGRNLVRVFQLEYGAMTDTIDVTPGRNPSLTIRFLSSRIAHGEIFIPGPRRVVSRGDLVAEITPVRSPLKVYQVPSFRVRIWNRSERDIVLVHCKGRGSPRGTFQVAAPFDAFARTSDRAIAFCGTNGFGVTKWDFIVVEPGQYFEPFDQAEVTPDFGGAVPTRPGHYGVTFRYSTSESDVSRWTNLRPDAEMLELLAMVPVVDLEAKASFKVDY